MSDFSVRHATIVGVTNLESLGTVVRSLQGKQAPRARAVTGGSMRRTIAVGALAFSLIVSLAPNALAQPENPADEIPAEFQDLTEGIDEPDAGVPIPSGDAGNADLVENAAERIAREIAHAFGSEDALDRRGYEESLYQGKWYMPKREDVRRCIMKRESSHNYKAVSAGGLYRGAYQMSKRLAIGATWMMQAEVRKEFGDAAVEVVKALRERPIQQWNRYWQDRAFWTIWRDGKGKHHWRGGAYSC